MPNSYDITVAVPAYSRVSELEQLLESVARQDVMPAELLICEDCSPERADIRRLCLKWTPILSALGCHITFHENASNLGYDANVRSLFSLGRCKWIMLLGNDDALLTTGIASVKRYLEGKPDSLCVSRTFVKFTERPDEPTGISKLFSEDQRLTADSHSPRFIFRCCGFVGGLVFNREWAQSRATDEFDGGLYYQIYLACVAYCEVGIDYIATPTIAGRAGNPPLFGSAKAEFGVHIPGSYTTEGRARMWSSVIEIAERIGKRRGMDLASDIRHELAGRQSFHIFETLATAGRARNIAMKNALQKLGLFSSPIPKFLFALNFVLGRYSALVYIAIRRAVQ